MVDVPVPPFWLLLSAVLACLAAGAGVLPGLVLAARRAARVARRGAYERCARQLTWLGPWCGLALALAGGGLLYARSQDLLALPESLSRWAALLPLAPWLAGLAVAGGLLCLALRLVDVRSAALTCLALSSMVCVWALLALGAALGAALALPAQDFAALLPAGELSAPPYVRALALAQALFQTLALRPLAGLGLGWVCLCLGLATAGGLALIVQILRRNIDDYGRDYYMLAARWCAARAGWGGIGLVLAAGLGWYVTRPLGGALWMWALACGGIALVATLAWLGVARSENPLRWKILMLIGALGVFLFAAGAAVMAAIGVDNMLSAV